ncbi:YadA C-terminal domain-containing protein [Sneathia sp. DSM 16631]|uniref:YadA family autotransporter adhesin n=1 Tax=Sneathia sp. DSM 16631 TaxID=2777994 RepID=UPI001868819C|nr:YadA C-terminal domain-containing protein [Sneathia sp. DSM 16631]MBE3030954.1 YadA C-terminal domain-containing protein [Sneathia sp. DSM 16631]
MKKATISLIFLISSSLTFTNQLLCGNHQAGAHGCPKYSLQQQDDTPSEEDQKIAALRNEINNKIDRLAKNDDDKIDIKNAFEIDSTDDLNKLKKAKEYVDALFEDYDTNIHYLRTVHASPDNDGFLYFVNRKKSIDQKIDALSKTANHALDGVSLAVAMANLPTVSSEYNHNISASYGTYAGSHSFALGLSGHIANDRLSYKLSGAVNTKGNLAFGVGVGVNLGKKNQSNKELLDRIEKLENLVKQLQNK